MSGADARSRKRHCGFSRLAVSNGNSQSDPTPDLARTAATASICRQERLDLIFSGARQATPQFPLLCRHGGAQHRVGAMRCPVAGAT
jgi:hypothetical protein